MKRIAVLSLATLVAVGWLAAGAAPTPGGNAVSRGRGVALSICGICHVVAWNQRDAPVLNQQTPSFEDIANAPSTTAKSLRRFVTTTHWDENTAPMTMPHYDLSARQVDDVVAYILSLRKQPGAAAAALPPQKSGSGPP